MPVLLHCLPHCVCMIARSRLRGKRGQSRVSVSRVRASEWPALASASSVIFRLSVIFRIIEVTFSPPYHDIRLTHLTEVITSLTFLPSPSSLTSFQSQMHDVIHHKVYCTALVETEEYFSKQRNWLQSNHTKTKHTTQQISQLTHITAPPLPDTTSPPSLHRRMGELLKALWQLQLG